MKERTLLLMLFPLLLTGMCCAGAEENRSAAEKQGWEPVCRITQRARSEDGTYTPTAPEAMQTCRGLRLSDPRKSHPVEEAALYLLEQEKVLVIQSFYMSDTFIYHLDEHRVSHVENPETKGMDYTECNASWGEGGYCYGAHKMGLTGSSGQSICTEKDGFFMRGDWNVYDYEGKYKGLSAFDSESESVERTPDNTYYPYALHPSRADEIGRTGIWLMCNPAFDALTDPLIYRMQIHHLLTPCRGSSWADTAANPLQYARYFGPDTAVAQCYRDDEHYRRCPFLQTDYRLQLRDAKGKVLRTILEWKPRGGAADEQQKIGSTYGYLEGEQRERDLLFFYWTHGGEAQRNVYAYCRPDGTLVDSGDFRTLLSKEATRQPFDMLLSPEEFPLFRVTLPQKVGKYGVALLQRRQAENGLYMYIIVRPGCSEVIEIQSPNLLFFLPKLLNGGTELIAVSADGVLEYEPPVTEGKDFLWVLEHTVRTGSHLYRFTLPKAWGEEE